MGSFYKLTKLLVELVDFQLFLSCVDGDWQNRDLIKRNDCWGPRT